MRTHARTAQATEDLGAQLARTRPVATAGPVVLYLSGELGSGKTTFARGFLRGCGVTDAVRSPTYTLLEPYSVGTLTVVHVDLYRLRDPGEVESLGLRDYARSGHVWLIEWPARGGTHLPPADLNLEFAAAPHGHDIEVQARSPLGRTWLGTPTGHAA
jgi:tRNA threonylcarbamoyladenosine biosynthesis protein TsaE